ncbi:glycoside hydrolase [Rubrivirga sp.]|uniref:glycoside hydrolase n=1 Tax=Rubrivirga sp. TaxID=1885344 RepID=UPI003B51B375
MSRAGLLALALGALALVSGGCRDASHWAPPPSPWSGDDARPPSPDDWTTLVDLDGTWEIRIGDAPASADTTDGWTSITVPAAWEDQGFPGYDGFAWYRTTFALDAKTADLARVGPPFLLLGRIDDADEVWLNGTRVGWGGRMPPFYETAAFRFRAYRVPPDLLRTDGPNELAVRVYDAGVEGGILEGPIALAVPTAQNPASVPVVADLAGDWRFQPGDDPAYSDPALDDRAWATIRVPGAWERQGYRDLDGLAWYRTTVRLSAEDAARDLVLVLGLIDDLDEAFVNGVRVGATGDPDTGTVRGDEWQVERAYPVPASALRAGDNVVAVRVFDGPNEGGIYRGPVALVTRQAFAERERRARGDDR